MEFQIGDIVKLKKAHPCGINEWEILRVGMDFRLKCVGCGRQVMVPRKMNRLLISVKSIKAVLQIQFWIVTEDI